MTALKNAVAYAEQLSITNSLTELVDARDKIANAVAYLVPIQQDTLETVSYTHLDVYKRQA